VTVAVAVDVVIPFAVIDAGLNPTTTLVAGPGVCVNVAVAATLGSTVLSVAVVVN
jgi:hypothetical protein